MQNHPRLPGEHCSSHVIKTTILLQKKRSPTLPHGACVCNRGYEQAGECCPEEGGITARKNPRVSGIGKTPSSMGPYSGITCEAEQGQLWGKASHCPEMSPLPSLRAKSQWDGKKDTTTCFHKPQGSSKVACRADQVNP